MPPKFPNGKPVTSEVLDSGLVRHVMNDGRVFEIRPNPDYLLEYQSRMFDALPGDGYEVKVSMLGRASDDDYYEVWNFKINQLRWYSYEDTLKLTDIEDGTIFSADQLWNALHKK